MQSPERVNTFCLHKEPHHRLSMEQKMDKETELTSGFTIEKAEKNAVFSQAPIPLKSHPQVV